MSEAAGGIRIAPLAAHRHRVPQLAAWLRDEWPQWYGPSGNGDVEADLLEAAGTGRLPVGVLALCDGEPCGVAALKARSIASHAHLGPWATAGYVIPSLRGRGIGRLLLSALEAEARLLGHPQIYCATATAASLLQRCGWSVFDGVVLDGQRLTVFRKLLPAAD